MSKLHQTVLVKTKQVAENTFEVTLERPANFFFKAGQYIQLAVPKLTYVDYEGPSRLLSIASSPTDQEHLAVIFRHSGSGFKQTLLELPVGSPLQIEGPHGHFVLNQTMNKPVVFVAGGIGVTPFLSMIQWASEIKFGQQLFLVRLDKSDRTAVYLPELRRLVKNHQTMHLVNCNKRVSSELLGDVSSKVGGEALWYIAGPPGMVTEVRHLLVNLDIPENHILTDEFTGY